MAHNLAYLECQVPPRSRAAGVAISRARWHDEGDSHWSKRTPPIFFIVTERPSPQDPVTPPARLDPGNQDSDLPAGMPGVPGAVDDRVYQ
jgi:hypothetical protein